MALKNSFVKYTDRSYKQIKTSILSKFTSNTPELTDTSENNFFVRLVSVWAGITEMLGYYIDNIAREVYLHTARQYVSAINSAKLFNYRIRGVKTASVKLRFTIDKEAKEVINIPKGTIVSTKDNIEFKTIIAVNIGVGSTSVEVEAKQGKNTENLLIGESDGTKNQEFIVDKDVEDKSLKVYIGGVEYSFIDSFHLSTDTDKVYSTSLNIDKKMIVKFGDGITGEIPAINEEIKVDYSVSNGNLGNLPVGVISTIISQINTPRQEVLTVDNIEVSSGGVDIESFEELKNNIPRSIKTLNRGVTIQDVKDLVLLFGGIDSVIIEKVTTGVDVYISIIGGGSPTNTFKENLLNYLKSKMQQLVLIEYKIKGVSILYPKITLSVKLKDEYLSDVAVKKVKDTLIENVADIDIKQPLIIGNIYQWVENLIEVDYSDKILLSYEILVHNSNNDKELPFSNLLIKATDNTFENLYKIEILHNSSYRLSKNGTATGDFDFNFPQSQKDFDITITPSNTVIGDYWEFYIYNINSSIYPKTISSYILKEENITINEL